MVKRTVLKVNISCQKCKQELIKAVSRLEGIDKIEVDTAKSTLTVTGDADPMEVIVRTRKTGKFAEVVSIGPPPPAPKPGATAPGGEKKPEEKKPQESQTKYPEPPAPLVIHVPSSCMVCQCQQVGFHDPNSSCSIM